MSKRIGEKKALKILKINDFAELAPENIGKFKSIFAEMDPEVAKKALENVPDLVSATKDMVGHYKDVTTKGLESGDESIKPFYEACKQIIDSLDRELQKEDLTQEDRDHIISQMIKIAQMMDDKDERHKEFVKEVLKTGGQVIVFAAITVAAIAGGKDFKLPGK